jgi:hypothetical protein
MITVVIASYGYGHLAAHCIESILSQLDLDPTSIYPELREKNLGTVAIKRCA